MFGLEYLTAFIKVLFQLAFAIVSAILFNPAWNCVAQNYLSDWLPEQFINIPYWHFVAIILVFTFIGEQIRKLVPKLVEINTPSSGNK